MPAYTLRSDPQVDAALTQLGATPGTRSKIIRAAILAYAERQADYPTTERAAAVMAELENMRTVIDAATRLVRELR